MLLAFLNDTFFVLLGVGLYQWIKWLVKRDIAAQSQVGGRGSVNVQVGGSIKGDGELGFESWIDHDDIKGRREHGM